MAQRTVWTAKGKGVGKVGDPHAEVGRHAFFPHVADVNALGYKGEAREPGGVEACGADYDVDRVGFALVVNEAAGRDGADGIGEDGGVGCHEGFQVAWGRRWATTSRVEVLGNHFLDENRIMVQFCAHLAIGVASCCAGFLAALEDEFEALVQLIFNLFAVLEVLFRVLL